MKKTLTAFVTAAVAVLVSGCNIETGFDDKSVGYESYPVSEGYVLLSITNGAGNVTVTASDVDSVSIDYTRIAKGTTTSIFPRDYSKDIDVKIEADKSDSTITITTKLPESPTISYSVDFEIKVPRNMVLDIQNDAGNLIVDGLEAKPARLVVTAGNMTLTGFKCGVEASDWTGNLDCAISSLPSNQSVVLKTSTGNSNLKISAMDTSNTIRVDVATGNADVTLPSNVELSFDMSVTTGQVSVNGYTPTQGSPWTDTHKVGTIGAGATKSALEAVAGTGNVTLNKGE